MFILKKDRKLRNVLTVALVFASALFVDANLSTPPNSENLQEARFLGIGREVELTPCVMGQRTRITTYTFLWIKIGDSSYDTESC